MVLRGLRKGGGRLSWCPFGRSFSLSSTRSSETLTHTQLTYSLTCSLASSLLLQQSLLRTLAPLGDRILVRRAVKETQTASGIILPADTTKDPNEGEVVAVGPGERDVTGALHAVTVSVGDQVLLPEYGGMKVKIGGNDEEEMFLFRESDILGKFE